MSISTTSVLATLLIASTVTADIGFSAAVDASRAAAPAGTLFGIKQRVRNNIWIYEGELYNAALTTQFQPRINRDTGALIRVDLNAVSKSQRAALHPIADRLGEVQIDFAAALAIANASTQRSDAERIAYDLEAGILAYQVNYFDGVTKIYVDSVTGGVIPHHGANDDMDDTNPSTSVIGAIGVAEGFKGEGWVTIGMESEAEKGGNIVEVLLLDLQSGMLSMVNVGGDAVLSSNDFQPVGSQIARIQRVRNNWNLVHTGLAAAVAAAEGAYPGAGISEAEFAVEVEDAGTTVQWKINLITADLIEIDYIVDASTPAANGFRFATAPVTVKLGDINRDGVVNARDMAELFDAWGVANPLLDLNGDGVVGSRDLAVIFANWS